MYFLKRFSFKSVENCLFIIKLLVGLTIVKANLVGKKMFIHVSIQGIFHACFNLAIFALIGSWRNLKMELVKTANMSYEDEFQA